MQARFIYARRIWNLWKFSDLYCKRRMTLDELSSIIKHLFPLVCMTNGLNYYLYGFDSITEQHNSIIQSLFKYS